MSKRLDLLAGVYVSSSVLLIICSYLAPHSVRQLCSTIVTLDTRPHLGETASLDFLGRCFLGPDQLSCRDLTTAVIRHRMTGYETEDQVHRAVRSIQTLEHARGVLASFWFFHGMLLLGNYAILSYEWYTSAANRNPACERILRRLITCVLLCATLAGTIATASGLAVGLQYSEVLGAGDPASDLVRVGSGWMVTLCASIGCFYPTVASLGLDTSSDSDKEEGRIALPLDDCDERPKSEKYEYRQQRQWASDPESSST